MRSLRFRGAQVDSRAALRGGLSARRSIQKERRSTAPAGDGPLVGRPIASVPGLELWLDYPDPSKLHGRRHLRLACTPDFVPGAVRIGRGADKHSVFKPCAGGNISGKLYIEVDIFSPELSLKREGQVIARGSVDYKLLGRRNW